MEGQLFQNQEQRMDDSKDNELIVLKSNWSVGFLEVYRSIIESYDYCWRVMELMVMWRRG